MAENFIIEENSFPVKKSAFEGLDVLAGIDRGCSLTKLLFVTEGKTDDVYNVNAILVANKNFDKALDLMAEKKLVRLGEGSRLRVTGAGCDKYKEAIQERLGMQLEFINELVTMFSGVHWLISNLAHSEIFYNDEADIDLTMFEQKADNPEASKLSQQWQVQEEEEEGGDGKEKKEESFLPCLYCLIGSGGGFLHILASGECRLVSGIGLAGKAFLGYGKMLLGTSDYDEIVELASRGRRGNVDNEGRDLLLEDSAYGKMPPSMPIFPFGKAVDRELKLSDCRKEDVAHSLVAAFAANLFNFVCTSAKLTNSTKIVLGGNFFRHAFVRHELLKQQKYFEMHSITMKFLRTGHSGAIGAMISSPDDTSKILFAD